MTEIECLILMGGVIVSVLCYFWGYINGRIAERGEWLDFNE